MGFHFQFVRFLRGKKYITSGTDVTKKWEIYIQMLVWLKKYAFSLKTGLPEKVQSCNWIQIQSSYTGSILSLQLLRPGDLMWLSHLTCLTHQLQHKSSPFFFFPKETWSQFCGLANASAWFCHNSQGTHAPVNAYCVLPCQEDDVSYTMISVSFFNVCQVGGFFADHVIYAIKLF